MARKRCWTRKEEEDGKGELVEKERDRGRKEKERIRKNRR